MTIDGIRGVVIDIEGTTSATATVHVGLYDHARPRIGRWLVDHADEPDIAAAISVTRQAAGLADDAPLDAVAAALLAWMDGDVKATPLKTVQGQIWAAGFADGDLVGHVFDDVAPAMTLWASTGVHLAIFSSGSIAVQRPWFRHSDHGDLSSLIEAYFDTVNGGPKRERVAYDTIATDLTGRWSCAPSDLLFLSDVPAELDAAAEAGWQTIGVRRPGEPNGDADFGRHRTVASFAEIRLGNAADHVAGDGEEPSADVVVAAGTRLAAEAARFAGLGWMRGTSGNLSEVLERAPLRLAVTSSGVDKGEMTGTDVVVVDRAGAPIAIADLVDRRPSAEAGLHARVAAETGAGAVVHVHALSAVVAARRWPGGVALRDVEMLKGIGRAAHGEAVIVPVIANSQDMDELGDRFVASRRDGVPAVIVAGHGMYVWGDDLRQARHHTESIEWLLSFALATADFPNREEPT